MGDYIAVHIPSSAGDGTYTGGIFPTVQAAAKYANTPEAKARGGARFKRFTSPEAAQAYVEHGDDNDFASSLLVCSPESPSSSGHSNVLKNSFSEAINTYPSVTHITLNRLRRAIETKDNEAFENIVKENPRCLINTGSDRPTIIFEGCRYNSLHVAAKSGNAHVTRYILKFVCDLDSLSHLYGTSVEDVRNRSKALLDSYLNTPDKGAGDTPLHFASKFGHKEVVEVLLRYEECEKERLNNDHKSAGEVCASRYVGDDKQQIRHEILSLFSSFYVPLYRPADNSASAIICPPGRYPSATYTGEKRQRIFTDYILSAVAGPFSELESAQKFYKEWVNSEKEKRLRDPIKGAEGVGRILANSGKVKWMERWPFSQKLLELNSYNGLEVLNSFLLRLRYEQVRQNTTSLEIFGSVRKRLNFDEEKDDESSDDEFWDTSDSFENGVNLVEDGNLSSEQNSFESNDSMAFLIKKVNALKLDDSDAVSERKGCARVCLSNSSFFACEGDNSIELEKNTLKRGFPEFDVVDLQDNSASHSKHEAFFTPPSSPVPVYISGGLLTKDDENVLNALSLVDGGLINQFPTLKEYMRKIKKVPVSEREQLPYTDSPRAKAKKKPFFGLRPV